MFARRVRRPRRRRLPLPILRRIRRLLRIEPARGARRDERFLLRGFAAGGNGATSPVVMISGSAESTKALPTKSK